MRTPRRVLLALATLATLAAVAEGVTILHGSGTARAAFLPPPLPVSGFADMEVDGEHVFLSGGPQSSEIVVANLTGAVIGNIPGQTGAVGLALSRDGRTLYAALKGAGAVSAIDTGTLTERARYATGTCPVNLAVTDRVWFGYGCASQDGGIGSIDVAAAEPTVSLNLQDGVFYARPPLLTAARGANLLVAGEDGSTPSKPHSYAQTADGKLRRLASGARGDVGQNLTDIAVVADGTKVYTASGFPGELRAFATDDLTPRGRLVIDSYPQNVTVSPDGALVAGGSEGVLGSAVYVFETRDHTRRPVLELDSARALQRNGLAWSRDGQSLFAVTADRSGSEALRLWILPTPGPASADAGTGVRAAAAAPVPLPLPAAKDIEATDRHVFISGGAFANEIVVTDLAGNVIRRIPGQAGAHELALSRDGRTLYAVLQATGTVSAIDTDTLQERTRYITRACPSAVAVTDRVWFSHACDAGWYGGIGRIDVAATDPTAVLNQEAQEYYVAPRLFTPMASNLVTAIENAGGEARTFDVYAQAADGKLTKRNSTYLRVSGAALSPDGSTLYVASAGFRSYAMSDLTLRRELGGSANSAALTLAGDRIAGGSNGTAGPTVEVFNTGGRRRARATTFQLGAGLAVPWGTGVAWSRDGTKLFAVTTSSTGSVPFLHVLTP